MRLKLSFEKDSLDYAWYQPPLEFHHLVIFKGKKWLYAICLDDPDKKYDYICLFEEVKSYDPNSYATTYYDLDKEMNSRLSCECGSDKHGFAGHAFWCPKWTKM